MGTFGCWLGLESRSHFRLLAWFRVKTLPVVLSGDIWPVTGGGGGGLLRP